MNRAERRQVSPTRAQLEARSKRRRAVLVGSFGVLALVIVIAVVLGSRVPKTASDAPPVASKALAVGEKAPDFAVSTTHGPFQLSKAAGKPTLLEVFATWCPHCQRETAVLDTLNATYGARANVVAVSGSPYAMDQSTPESQADVVAFMTKFNVTYPVAFDPDLAVAKSYLSGGFPTVVLVGRNGTIQAIRDGEIPTADLQHALDASLAGKTPDPKMGQKA